MPGASPVSSLVGLILLSLLSLPHLRQRTRTNFGAFSLLCTLLTLLSTSEMLSQWQEASFVICGFCASGAAAARSCHIQAEQGAGGSQISPKLEAARS